MNLLLKNIKDIIIFINFDYLYYNENKEFLEEMEELKINGKNVFQYLEINIWKREDDYVFILQSEGLGYKIRQLLNQDGYASLAFLGITRKDIKKMRDFAKLFNLDLVIKREMNLNRHFVYTALLDNKNLYELENEY